MKIRRRPVIVVKRVALKVRCSSHLASKRGASSVDRPDCIACSGTGWSSNGSVCWPCDGTGKRKDNI